MLACKTIPFSPESSDQNLITIAEGGGFAGIETKFFFTESGDVYQQVGRDTSLIPMKRVKRQVIEQVFSTVEQMELMSYKFDAPGNAYKYLRVSKDGIENKIVWGSPDDEVKPVCKSIFTLLKQSMK